MCVCVYVCMFVCMMCVRVRMYLCMSMPAYCMCVAGTHKRKANVVCCSIQPTTPTQNQTSMSQAAKKQKLDLPNAILFGTGEYTTGYVHGGQSKSDKSAGVVGLVFFDLRHRGKVGSRLGFCGTSGGKFPGLRKHLQVVR